MGDDRGPVGGTEWQQAYMQTIAVCFVFTSIALLVFGFGLSSTTLNGGIALSFTIALMITSLRLLTARGSLAALPYFLIGCAVFYGLGTFVATIVPESMYQISFTSDVQRKVLAQVNATNFVAITVVVLAAAPLCMFPAGSRTASSADGGLQSVMLRLEQYMPALLIASVPIVAIMWATFPRPTNFLLASLLTPLSGVPLFTVLLAGAIWTRLDGGRKALIVLLILALVLHGMLGMRKMFTILPIMSLVMGMMIFPRTRVLAGVIVVCVIVIYGAGMADTLNYGRLHVGFDPLLNGPLDRLRILWDTVGSLREVSALQQEEGSLLQRFTIAPFEAHFIGLYDSGAPGDSLRNFFNVLVPRAIWPDKPIISPGAEFDGIFRGYFVQSSLAIGFIAEAYWNLGWLGVILISAMIGLQMGWFTRRWHLFCQHGFIYSGIFLMSPLIIKQSLWVETNIVGGYVGGVVKLMIYVTLIDMLIRVYVARTQRAERLMPANTLTRQYG